MNQVLILATMWRLLVLFGDRRLLVRSLNAPAAGQTGNDRPSMRTTAIIGWASTPVADYCGPPTNGRMPLNNPRAAPANAEGSVEASSRSAGRFAHVGFHSIVTGWGDFACLKLVPVYVSSTLVSSRCLRRMELCAYSRSDSANRKTVVVFGRSTPRT